MWRTRIWMVLRGDWLNTLCLMARLGQPVKETGSNLTMEGETSGEQGRTQQSSTVDWLERRDSTVTESWDTANNEKTYERRVFRRAQMVKNTPAMQEIWVWSLGWEDPLEEGMATYSSILAWRIQWAEEPGGLSNLRDDAVKVLHSICQQIWKTQQWPQDWKRFSFHSSPKERQCQRVFKVLHVVLISHASKVLLKSL